MKKVILLGLLISFLGGLEAAAQGPASKVVLAAGRHTAVTRKLSSTQIEKILKERVARSYQTHFENLPLGAKLALYTEETPPEKILNWNKFSSPGGKSPYEDLFFWNLISEEAKQNYFLAANNRAIARVARERENAERAVKENLSKLWRRRLPAVDQPQDKTLLQAIPSRAKYLLLGEVHEHPEIIAFVGQFVRGYQAKFPDRKIIFLTEFLPSNPDKSFSLRYMTNPTDIYVPLFQSLLRRGVPVKGLEHRYVAYNWAEGVFATGALEEKQMDIWTSPEGMRLRNQFWLQQISRWRSKYPNAVFIIYAGEQHLSYNVPFSLAQQLPPEEVFVAQLFPKWIPHCNEMTVLETVGEDWGYSFAQEPVLRWKDPVLRRIAGADIRLRIPLPRAKK